MLGIAPVRYTGPNHEKGTTMAGYLTTHVLDTARGSPAQGLKIELFRLRGTERADDERAVTLARSLADRRFGIGADQVLALLDSNNADVRMDIYNADGGRVEMCGNGIRCFAKYVWDRDIADRSPLSVETLAGTIRPERSGDRVRTTR